MRVSVCEKCEYHKRKCWVQRHTPATGKTVGFTHAYGYCMLNDCRCLDVKKCSVHTKQK